MTGSWLFSENTGRNLENRVGRILHAGENALAYLSLLSIAVFPFLDVLARHFFHTDVQHSNEYLIHLVLVATFLGGMVTSRMKKHLTLSVEVPLKEPLQSVLCALVQCLCASITFAFAWSSLAFALNGFEAGAKVGILPLRGVLLVMVLGYATMGVRFIIGQERIGRPAVWLAASVLLGSVLGFSSIVQSFAGAGAKPPAVIAALQAPLQSAIAKAASPLIIVLILSVFFGAPIFVALGGAAYLLFARQASPLEIMPNQAYNMLTGYSIAAIPMFAVTGFLLSADKAGERLVKFFRAFFAWFPGGLAVVAILVCAFFTTFTGASGVTILAMGGMLSYILINGGYRKQFTIGLLTAAGSIGLLFPPSLPVILYGVTAQISIKDMFLGGVLPGLILVAGMVTFGIVYAVRHRVERHHFRFREALPAFRESIWEILMPLVVFVGYFGVGTALVWRFAVAVVFLLVVEVLVRQVKNPPNLVGFLITFVPPGMLFGLLLRSPRPSWIGLGLAAAASAAYGFLVARPQGGPPADVRHFFPVFGRFIALVVGLLLLFAATVRLSLTLVESAAVALVYTMLVQVVVRRDLRIRDLSKVLSKCLPIVGGVLIILSLANGLSYYLVDSDIPAKLTAWIQSAVASKFLFLLLLDLFLIVVGCFLEIYSAILIVAPLIFPLGQVFGIAPVHLGIVFLASLELGYLTPPIGLNLLLSSYRFNEPVSGVAKTTFKFLLVQLAAVLLISYVPFLTDVFLKK
jgi:C4-dicarboxylate transporter DctM subunit